MTRRFALLAAGLALGLTATAASAETELVPASQVFQFLDRYYALPPAERSRFTLSYHVRAKDKSPVSLTLIDGATETPLPVASDGRPDRLPTAAQLAAKAKLRVVSSTKDYGASLAPEASVRIGPEISVADIMAAHDQVATAVKHMAGLASLMVPHFDRAVFPRAEGAVLVGADGKETPLAIVRNAPSLDLTALHGAKAVRFAKPPAHVYLLPPAK